MDAHYVNGYVPKIMIKGAMALALDLLSISKSSHVSVS